MAAKRPGALLLGVGVALSLLPGPALAHDHTPPRVVLRSPGDGQVGRPWSYEWTARESENTCSGVSADGIPNYQRRAIAWRPKRRIHLRLYKRHKPTGLVIRMYVRLSDSANPAGRGRRADYRLRRTRLASGRRIWIAGFVGRRDARRHLYLDVTVRYRDVEGCGGSQNMVLAFHLRRRGTRGSLLSSSVKDPNFGKRLPDKGHGLGIGAVGWNQTHDFSIAARLGTALGGHVRLHPEDGIEEMTAEPPRFQPARRRKYAARR